MVYTLDEIKKRVFPVIQKYNIPAMYLFGSYARGETTEESDLDFLVDTTGTNRHIKEYCVAIGKAIERYGNSFEIYTKDADYQRSVSFSIYRPSL